MAHECISPWNYTLKEKKKVTISLTHTEGNCMCQVLSVSTYELQHCIGIRKSVKSAGRKPQSLPDSGLPESTGTGRSIEQIREWQDKSDQGK